MRQRVEVREQERVMLNPRVGDGVWLKGQSQPNGKIVHIDWHDKEVICECYDTRVQVVVEWASFDACWQNGINQWVLHEY